MYAHLNLILLLLFLSIDHCVVHEHRRECQTPDDSSSHCTSTKGCSFILKKAIKYFRWRCFSVRCFTSPKMKWRRGKESPMDYEPTHFSSSNNNSNNHHQPSKNLWLNAAAMHHRKQTTGTSSSTTLAGDLFSHSTQPEAIFNFTASAASARAAKTSLQSPSNISSNSKSQHGGHNCQKQEQQPDVVNDNSMDSRSSCNPSTSSSAPTSTALTNLSRKRRKPMERSSSVDSSHRWSDGGRRQHQHRSNSGGLDHADHLNLLYVLGG